MFFKACFPLVDFFRGENFGNGKYKKHATNKK